MNHRHPLYVLINVLVVIAITVVVIVMVVTSSLRRGMYCTCTPCT